MMPTPEQLARWEQRLDVAEAEVVADLWDAEPLEVPC